MSGIVERNAEIAGVGTRALELRPADAKSSALLFLHGFSDSADTWRPLLERLRRTPRVALAVDLPGFGRAERLDREAEILPQLDRFTAAAIERAAHDSPTGDVIVVGNSLGGCVAMRAAERGGLPIAGIVPIAPAGLDMAGWFAAIEGAWAIQTILRSPLPLPDAAIRGLVGETYRRLAAHRPRALAAAQVTAFTSHVATKRDVVRILGTGRRLRGELRSPFALDRIACPVLVIWGERDRMVFPAGAQRILDEVADARLELIPECGHCPQIECPDRVAALLHEFTASPRAHA
jgi:pimeloyl-ACP methyl ester carboxylesterase